MACHVGINGIGRIGGILLQYMITQQYSNSDSDSSIVVDAIVDATLTAEQICNRLQYDSVTDRYAVNSQNGMKLSYTSYAASGNSYARIYVNGAEIPCYDYDAYVADGAGSYWDWIGQIPWTTFNIQYVIDATGKLTTAEQAQYYLTGGARVIVIGDSLTDSDYKQLGVANTLMVKDTLDSSDTIFSIPSCETQAIAMLAYWLYAYEPAKTDQYCITGTWAASANNKDTLQDGAYSRSSIASSSLYLTDYSRIKAIGRLVPEMNSRARPRKSTIYMPSLSGEILNAEVIYENGLGTSYSSSERISGYWVPSLKALAAGDFNGYMEWYQPENSSTLPPIQAIDASRSETFLTVLADSLVDGPAALVDGSYYFFGLTAYISDYVGYAKVCYDCIAALSNRIG